MSAIAKIRYQYGPRHPAQRARSPPYALRRIAATRARLKSMVGPDLPFARVTIAAARLAHTGLSGHRAASPRSPTSAARDEAAI